MGQQNAEDEKLEFFSLPENGVYVLSFSSVNFNVDCMTYRDSHEMIYRFMSDTYTPNATIPICTIAPCLVQSLRIDRAGGQ